MAVPRTLDTAFPARRGTRLYLFLTMRPYDRIFVRGLTVARIHALTALFTGHRFGGVHIPVNPDLVDDLCTVVAIDMRPDP